VSRAAREWVRGLGEHLTGSPRALLWATADRANNAGEFWTSERTMASESGVSYPHVRRLVPAMVEVGVWDKLKPAAGPRPAVYRFTLIDPAGLPTALAMSAVGDGLVRSSETLVRSFEASSALMVSAKPIGTKEPPPEGGCLVHPESNDRDRDGPAADAAAAPAPAPSVPQHIKDEWRRLLAPPPSETDSVEEAAKKRAARERLGRHEREAADKAGQERESAS
jgi:hypothetical protein